MNVPRCFKMINRTLPCKNIHFKKPKRLAISNQLTSIENPICHCSNISLIAKKGREFANLAALKPSDTTCAVGRTNPERRFPLVLFSHQYPTFRDPLQHPSLSTPYSRRSFSKIDAALWPHALRSSLKSLHQRPNHRKPLARYRTTLLLVNARRKRDWHAHALPFHSSWSSPAAAAAVRRINPAKRGTRL